jgi:hypothetical protein
MSLWIYDVQDIEFGFQKLKIVFDVTDYLLCKDVP